MKQQRSIWPTERWTANKYLPCRKSDFVVCAELKDFMGRQGGALARVPIFVMGRLQSGHDGGGNGSGGTNGGGVQSRRAKMRWRRLLAAGASQPK